MTREFHPVSSLFPLTQGKEFDDLVADIREHGLREPIWLHKGGRILDGRNRSRACHEAGVEPRFNNYVGTPTPSPFGPRDRPLSGVKQK